MKVLPDMSAKFSRLTLYCGGLFSILTTIASPALGQMTPVRVPAAAPPPVEDDTWWYLTLFVLFAALAVAILWALKQRRQNSANAEASKNDKLMADEGGWDSTSVDADKEMEWFRRHKKTVGRQVKKNPKKKLADSLPKTGKIFNRATTAEDEAALKYSEKEFKEKLQSLQFNQMPVFKFTKLEMARPFSPLSISNDEALMSAIEQTYDEYEEDEQIRDLAVRILTRFRTRNSIEALSQVALYDISSNVRSKAVSILADFDHESVFETILLCCADPTREVRAAAARGLFRLSFDRADAWSRISETRDEFRMRQAALAAKEADLVKRSCDRLIHPDQKIAYEAVALLCLMLRAGEIEEVFKSIEGHHDTNVKLALLHVVALSQEESTLPVLYKLLEKPVSKELKEKIEKTIESFELIPA